MHEFCRGVPATFPAGSVRIGPCAGRLVVTMQIDLRLRGDNAAFWKLMRDTALPKDGGIPLEGPNSFVFSEFRKFLIERKAWRVFKRRLTAEQSRLISRMRHKDGWHAMKENVRDARRARYVQGAVCEIIFATPHTDSVRATREGLRSCLVFLGNDGGKGMRDSLKALMRCRTIPEMQALAARGRWLTAASPVGPKGKFGENMRGFWENFKGLRDTKD